MASLHFICTTESFWDLCRLSQSKTSPLHLEKIKVFYFGRWATYIIAPSYTIQKHTYFLIIFKLPSDPTVCKHAAERWHCALIPPSGCTQGRLTVMNCALCILNTALLWENSSKLSASSRVRWANTQMSCWMCGALPPSRARHERTSRWSPRTLLHGVSRWIIY